MKLALLLTLALANTGCGVYLHRGGGAYTFIGPGSDRVAGMCSSMARYGFGYFGKGGKCIHDDTKECPR